MRERLAVVIGLEVLVEGASFDSHDLRKLPYSQAHITRTLRALMDSGVLERVNTRKYLLTDEFSGFLKGEILGKTPRAGIPPFPVVTIFDICGLETWSEYELEQFVKRLKARWLELSTGHRGTIKG